MIIINPRTKILFLVMTFLSSAFLSTYQLPIKGKWIENADHKSIIVITENRFIELYKQDTLYSGFYQRENYSCDTNYLGIKSAEKVDFIKIEDGRCFEIISITGHELTLRYTPSARLRVFHK